MHQNSVIVAVCTTSSTTSTFTCCVSISVYCFIAIMFNYMHIVAPIPSLTPTLLSETPGLMYFYFELSHELVVRYSRIYIAVYFPLLDRNNKQAFTPSHSYYHLHTRLPMPCPSIQFFTLVHTPTPLCLTQLSWFVTPAPEIKPGLGSTQVHTSLSHVPVTSDSYSCSSRNNEKEK